MRPGSRPRATAASRMTRSYGGLAAPRVHCPARTESQAGEENFAAPRRLPAPPSRRGTRLGRGGCSLDPTSAGIHLAGHDAAIAVNVRRARHAGVKGADGAQDIDAGEVLRALELFEDGRVQHRFLIG